MTAGHIKLAEWPLLGQYDYFDDLGASGGIVRPEGVVRVAGDVVPTVEPVNSMVEVLGRANIGKGDAW